MSKDYPKPEFNKRWKWFLKEMRVQDWIVDLDINPHEPTAFSFEADPDGGVYLGFCSSHQLDKVARIWVSPAKCVANSENLYEVLFHELVHMVCRDVGIDDDSDPRKEFVWDRLAAVMESAYLAQVRPKVAKKKVRKKSR